MVFTSLYLNTLPTAPNSSCWLAFYFTSFLNLTVFLLPSVCSRPTYTHISVYCLCFGRRRNVQRRAWGGTACNLPLLLCLPVKGLFSFWLQGRLTCGAFSYVEFSPSFSSYISVLGDGTLPAPQKGISPSSRCVPRYLPHACLPTSSSSPKIRRTPSISTRSNIPYMLHNSPRGLLRLTPGWRKLIIRRARA